MSKGLPKLSTEAYKGVRDFYPEDQAIQNYIFGIWRKVAESFGYVEYGASILEPAELYEAKSSEEIVSEQTYTFIDRGERRVTLRPEMTPTLARMVAAQRRELAIPVRWYSIPNVFRYERPQRGRLREHWQLNCDLLGIAGVEGEIEVITLAHALMRSLGAKESDFEIRLNDRAALDALFDSQGLSEEQRKKMRRLLDKRDKIDNFDALAEELLGKPFEVHRIGESAVSSLIERLRERNIRNVSHDPSLVRGFEYYTGIVFELFDSNPENHRSLFGGGRYDNLLELFGAEKIPAVGFGMGDVTVRDFLETHKILPAYRPTTDLALCIVGDAAIPFAEALAKEFRERGIRVAVDTTERKVGDKIKAADKQHIPYIIAVGEEEMQKGTFTMKTLADGTEATVTREEVAGYIAGRNEQ